MKLTAEHFIEAMSFRGAWSRKQLQLLGVKWPLKKGWKHRLIGTTYPKEVINTFISLKNKHLKKKDLWFTCTVCHRVIVGHYSCPFCKEK